MRFEPTRLTDYTDEALLAEIRRVAALVNQPSLSTAAFKKHARTGITTVRRRFGGWREALQAAGLGHMYAETPPRQRSSTRARGWTKEQIIEEMKRVAAKLNVGTLTVAQFTKEAAIGPAAGRTRFGGWPQALRAAGLEPVNHGRRYSDQECFENLLRVWTHHGRPPRYQEMNSAPSSVGGKAFVVRWGTWNRAIHAFAEHVESEAGAPGFAEPDTIQTGPAPSPVSRLKPEDRREPSVGLRYCVLSRDRFQCVSCGRSPAHDAGCELHVDHVVPFSKGGKTTFENLRALCEKCNLGKGNALERDA